MWFSTEDGLHKFDGRSITGYHPYWKDSTNNEVYSIRDFHEDSNGIFWIGSWNSFSRFDPFTGTFKMFRETGKDYPSEGPSIVLDVFEDHQKQLWLGTLGNGLHHFDPEKEEFTQYPFVPESKEENFSLSNKHVLGIWEDGSGMIWIYTLDGVLNQLNPKSGEIKKTTYPPFLKSPSSENKVQLVKMDQFGKVWMGDQDHFYYWDPMSGIFETLMLPPLISSLYKVVISDVHRDRNGVIWISTAQNGLWRWDPKNNQVFSYQHDPSNDRSIDSDYLNCIYEDRSGIIWLGTKTKGVLYFDPSPGWFKHYEYNSQHLEGMVGNDIIGFTKAADDKIWILASERNGINRYDPRSGLFEYFELPSEKKKYIIRTLYESPKEPDVLWIGYLEQGLERWDLKTGEHINYRHNPQDTNSLSHDTVLKIYEDSDGLFWLGTMWGLNRLDRQTMQFTTFLPDYEDPTTSISHHQIWSIFEDKSKRFWIGTEEGLNEMFRSTGEFHRYLPDESDPNSLSNRTVRAIYEDSRGMLWIGTRSRLNLMDREKGTFTQFSNRTLEPPDFYWRRHDHIDPIIEDNSKRLWLGTERGISVLSEISGKGFNTKHFNQLGNDFLGPIRRGAAYKSEKGDIYFANKNGLFVLSPNQWKSDTLRAPIVFTDVKIFNESVAVTPDGSGFLIKPIYQLKHIDLSYREEIITFVFSMLAYDNPGLYQYTYQLEGLSDDWINIANSSSVTFTSLKPGTYTLRVKGTDENGQWNEKEASISFTIQPVWWQTIVFKIGSFLAFTALLIYLFTWRNKQIQKQNLRLQLEVNKRTENLNTTLQKLKSTQSDLIQSEKMAMLGTLIAGVAHEVNNPLGAISASNSNIIQSTKFLRENFPKIFQILSQEEQIIFRKLIDRIPVSVPYLVGKERREMKKKFIEQFQNDGLPNADRIAETLLEIGVNNELKNFYELFKSKEQELILDALYHSAQIQSSGQNIKLATHQAAKIVYALRSYSHNYKSETRVLVSVAETIDNVLILFQNNIKHGIEVEKNYGEVPQINANPDELQQVWTNIIQNAFQAMMFHGYLHIGIELREGQKTGAKSFNQAQQFVVISITDNGPGIDESVRDKLFEPLVTTKGPGEGSGLGLHICRRIIEDHQGEITFHSETGKTTFEVWLPIQTIEKKE
jgi:signal transduction histidine kinase/ligand-binding sensor domain-containing protein